MPVLAIFRGKGITKTMYESLRKEVHWENQLPDGAVFHVAGFDDKGDLHVADVWESTEKMNKFVEDRLLPAMKRLKIPAPEVEAYPTHNINAYALIEEYKLGNLK